MYSMTGSSPNLALLVHPRSQIVVTVLLRKSSKKRISLSGLTVRTFIPCTVAARNALGDLCLMIMPRGRQAGR